MQLSIVHTSRYVYDAPVQQAIQRMRLHPLSSASQTVVDWEIRVNGKPPGLSYLDGFGNRIDLADHVSSASEIVIESAGNVTTRDMTGVVGYLDDCAHPWLFLRETQLTKAGGALEEFAMSFSGMSNQLMMLHDLMEAIHDRFEFATGATDVDTDAETAWTGGTGVCQDYAHVFIAASRRLGIPARYISGYLLMDGQDRQAASHAWAGAYVDGLGWVGFDPANNICPNEHYVKLAAGMDYHGASPVKGCSRQGSGGSLSVEIDVRRAVA
ncbi:transglutaminase family protein [Burkholderia sp. Bp9031]|uniref:transglutaminase family protein n=1 Tax=Burkholderia sp. Bp9031 TaxID=2184566 RepID=UPI0007165E11|nr:MULTISPECIES: transglutaminase family protein [Burkholderia]RQZ04879.1 transglutaminase family protein [Burkholderia sp. Bp9031]